MQTLKFYADNEIFYQFHRAGSISFKITELIYDVLDSKAEDNESFFAVLYRHRKKYHAIFKQLIMENLDDENL